MNTDIRRLLDHTEGLNSIYTPLFYRIGNEANRQAWTELLQSGKALFVHDRINDQLAELIKSNNPSKRIAASDYPQLITRHLNGIPAEEYGVWVFYPWSGRLVHMLDKDEYADLRTNRNRYKITNEEQAALATKKLGIIGLSVGQSIALTLAMERGFGELRLADFDTLDLSNLNRIRTGVHNLGVSKTAIAAREIAEIDPFLNVICFNEGITEENMERFLTEGGKLDLLIDECDGLDVKIQVRHKARELQIPVLMDTSDRGMLDVERFDLEPERPILHGLAGDIDPKGLSELSNEDKVPIVLQIAGGKDISNRGKASMIEVQQSISTWPQLATSVILGGAVAADVTRRLLLNQFRSSGRYYIDLEQLIGDSRKREPQLRPNPFKPLTREQTDEIIKQALPALDLPGGLAEIDKNTLHQLLEAGNLAPSTGNDQPWRWVWKDRVLYLFHDEFYSFSFGDYRKIASFLTFGAVCENVVLKARQLHTPEINIKLLPLTEQSPLVAVFYFTDQTTEGDEEHLYNELVDYIPTRCTNRNLSDRVDIPGEILENLVKVAESVKGAKAIVMTDAAKIREVGKIVAACDRMRLLNEEGHYDFVNREMRWTPEDAERTHSGIDVRTLGLSKGQLSALEIIKDYDVIDFVREVKGGGLFEAATIRSVSCSSALVLITMPKPTAENYIVGGRSYERFWLAAEKYGLAVHPVISPLYFFPRLLQGNGEGLTAEDTEAVRVLRKRFLELFGIEDGLGEVFLTKLAYAPRPDIKLLRKPVEEVLYTDV